jgi:hypothetical protein
MVMINAISISNNRIRPSDEKAFIETLRTLSDLYPTNEFHANPNNPIGYIIQILGVYRDGKVIDRLENDALNCDPKIFQQISWYYQNKFVAKVIDDNNLNLMKYEAKLQKASKVEALDFVEGVRRYAANELRGLRTTTEKWLYEDLDNSDTA